jgi:hypothetical protein
MKAIVTHCFLLFVTVSYLSIQKSLLLNTEILSLLFPGGIVQITCIPFFNNKE